MSVNPEENKNQLNPLQYEVARATTEVLIGLQGEVIDQKLISKVVSSVIDEAQIALSSVGVFVAETGMHRSTFYRNMVNVPPVPVSGQQGKIYLKKDLDMLIELIETKKRSSAILEGELPWPH